MSKVRLYGSTSGYIELAAPAVAPDTTITLPSTAGAFGGLVAVKHVLKTDTFTASVTAGAETAVTGLSITHALSDANNKLIISAQFGTSGNADGQGQVGIAVANDGTLIAQPASPGSRTAVTTGARVTTGTDGLIGAYPGMTVVYEPGDTASHTYTVRAINIRSDTQTLYINRSEDDTDNALYPRGVSSFVIQEVAV